MATYQTSFSGLANGAALVTTGTGGGTDTQLNTVNVGTGVTRTIDTTDRPDTGGSVLFATGATNATVYAEYTSATVGTLDLVYFRFKIKFITSPTATTRVFRLAATAGTGFDLSVTTGRQLRILDLSAATVATFTTAIPLNQWVRIGGSMTGRTGTASDGSASVQLYLDHDSLTPDESVSVTNQPFRNQINAYRFGIVSSITNAPGFKMAVPGISNTALLGPYNRRPVLTMPSTATVAKSTNIVRTASATDTEGGAISYAWTVLSSPSGSSPSLTNANTAAVTFQSGRAGSYVLQCVATDPANKTDTKTTSVVVKPDVYVKTGGGLTPATMTRKA